MLVLTSSLVVLFFLSHVACIFAHMCVHGQSELMSAGARLGLSTTEEAALLSSVLYAHRCVADYKQVHARGCSCFSV